MFINLFYYFLHVYVCVVRMQVCFHVPVGGAAHVEVGALYVCLCVERSEVDSGNLPCFLFSLLLD